MDHGTVAVLIASVGVLLFPVIVIASTVGDKVRAGRKGGQR
jgi:hypothetical protein